MTRRLVLVVAAALYNDKGEILLAQRPEGKQLAGLWEFPGGKVEPGETPEAALVRELHEELSITVNESELEPITFASHTYAEFHLLMPLYRCQAWSGEVCPREGQSIAWVSPGDLFDYPAPPADLPLFGVLSGKRATEGS
ncbi:MAG: 8-oxo-dGTP diphosphatase MutT [Hyphomonas sp.]|nr:8-oxo-dGTP diphosphatase MutT [Hyphomonas sp.]HRX73587.1 8-oxo-dGTP diphosphatase MutT [Hyphomonas sp.]